MPDQRDAPHKYDMEHALITVCDWAGLMPAAALYGDVSADIPPGTEPQIYIICRRPRVSVVPDSFRCQAGALQVSFRSQRPDGDHALVSLSVDGGWPELTLEASPPYTKLTLTDTAGRYVGISAALLLAQLLSAHPTQRDEAGQVDEQFMDLEVLYVGQSMRSGGAAEGRLLQHETLQRILAVTQDEQPHMDVWIVLASFSDFTTMGALGPWEGAVGEAASIDHFRNVHSKPVSQRHRIALTEAALIRYFQPSFNDRFKGTFPRADHVTYGELYELDFNSVGFEFDGLHTVSTRLFSGHVERKFFHANLFRLHDAAERAGFLDFLH